MSVVPGIRRFLSALLLVAATGVAARTVPAPWQPFPDDIAVLVRRTTPLVPVSDGGLGASLLLLGEPGDGATVEVSRDGVPLLAAHRWTDDPWLVGLADLEALRYDPWGGRALDGRGRLDLRTLPADTSGAVVGTAFYKGYHEQYLRRIDYRSPRAPWELRFAFDEQMDQEGYGYPVTGAVPFAPARDGESRQRRAHTELRHRDPGGGELRFAYDRFRGERAGLAVYDVDRIQLWSQRASVAWRAADGSAGIAVYDVSSDVERDRLRKLEVDRRGLCLDWRLPDRDWDLSLEADAWRLADDGAGIDWLPAGETAAARAGTQSGSLAVGTPDDAPRSWRLAARWHRQAGWSPAARAGWRLPVAGGPHLAVQWGGRAPRLDELWTVDRVGTDDGSWILLPDSGLDWERLLRAELRWRGGWRGWRVAVTGAWRRLRDGIGWRDRATGTGRWANVVDLDGWRVTALVSRRFRLAGDAELTWRTAVGDETVHAGVPFALPPHRDDRLELRWQHAWFEGDGILELAYALDHRGRMDDPWLPAGAAPLPAVTFQNLLIGFRLVGVDLSVELRNLTGVRDPVSARAWSDGLDRRWRLRWTFRR